MLEAAARVVAASSTSAAYSFTRPSFSEAQSSRVKGLYAVAPGGSQNTRSPVFSMRSRSMPSRLAWPFWILNVPVYLSSGAIRKKIGTA